MEIRQLKAFIAIVETGTFTAGAERVHVTQAAISMQIKQLETEVGTRLLTRAPRRVMLTEAGEALLERARRILREHDAALAELAELAGAERGRLRIGSASAMVSADPLPLILKDLKARHPQAEISISSGTSDALVRHILAGELDVAFVSLPVEVRGIETEVLSRDQLVAIASPRHPLAAERKVTAEMLAGVRLILGERGGNTRRLIDQFFARAGAHPDIAMELSRLAAIKRMAEEEMGVGIVPLQSAREEIAEGRLIAWEIEGAEFKWELGLARLSDGYHSPISQSFARICHHYFSADASPNRSPRRASNRKSGNARPAAAQSRASRARKN